MGGVVSFVRNVKDSKERNKAQLNPVVLTGQNLYASREEIDRVKDES